MDPQDTSVINQPKMEPTVEVSYLIVRKSAIFLIFQLMTIEGMFLVVNLIVYSPTLLENLFGTLPEGFFRTVPIILIFFLLGKIGLSIWVMLWWINEYYEILPGEIIHWRGIIARHKEVYSCKEVKSMQVDQTFLGRIFRYGTIVCFSPALNQRIILGNIGSPNRYQKIIAKFLPQLDTSQSTFFRTNL